MAHVVFEGKNAQEAYSKVRQKYGEDFEVLNAKQVRFKNGESRFEITAFVEGDIHDDLIENTENFETPAKKREREENKALKEEIAKLKEEMELFKKEIFETEKSSLPDAQVEFFAKNGISKEWLKRTIKDIKDDSILKDAQKLKAYILDEIDSNILCKNEKIDPPKIILFAGPTGVGKTTSLAKLAARFGYMFTESYSVAMINLDHYRVGAGAQIEKYAEMMGLSYRNVYNTAEFSDEIKSLKGIDIILVDTAGISPFDLEKLSQTISYIVEDTDCKIATMLVMSATFKTEDLQNMYDHFSFLDLEGLILTKFDETNHIGSLIDFLLTCPTPVSYIASGQEVPDDLEVATNDFIMNKFKKSL